METVLAAEPDPFTLRWLRPPMLNPTTRLAFAADPATGRLAVQGWESDGVATRPLNASFAPASVAPVSG
jgi:hypothetical protein